jgi:hypothetical protein
MGRWQTACAGWNRTGQGAASTHAGPLRQQPHCTLATTVAGHPAPACPRRRQLHRHGPGGPRGPLPRHPERRSEGGRRSAPARRGGPGHLRAARRRHVIPHACTLSSAHCAPAQPGGTTRVSRAAGTRVFAFLGQSWASELHGAERASRAKSRAGLFVPSAWSAALLMRGTDGYQARQRLASALARRTWHSKERHVQVPA